MHLRGRWRGPHAKRRCPNDQHPSSSLDPTPRVQVATRLWVDRPQRVVQLRKSKSSRCARFGWWHSLAPTPRQRLAARQVKARLISSNRWPGSGQSTQRRCQRNGGNRHSNPQKPTQDHITNPLPFRLFVGTAAAVMDSREVQNFSRFPPRSPYYQPSRKCFRDHEPRVGCGADTGSSARIDADNRSLERLRS